MKLLALLLTLCCLSASKNPHYATIYLAQSPSGMGYLSGAGNYYVGSTITIATQPWNATFTFHSWQDGNTNYTRQITVPKYGQTFTAYYVPIPPPPAVLTNAFVYWDIKPSTNYDYKVTCSGFAPIFTYQTNYTLTGLTNSARYSVFVNTLDTNGLVSSPSCTLSFVAGVKGTNSCP